MANEPKTPGGQKNEGEGNKTAARQFNKDEQDFVKSGKVREAAQEAERAVDGKEGDELRAAEERGRSKAKGQDASDYAKKQKH